MRSLASQSEYMALRDRMIGAMMRQAREAEGLSLDDVAERAQVAIETLQSYELGRFTCSDARVVCYF